jgi:NAD-dependent SIR2 family protein deacetylase
VDDAEGVPAARREAAAKPRACPACGSARVGTILYGEPSPSAKFFKDVKEGRIVVGGCCITGDDPAWQCADCGQQVFRKQRS